LAISRFKKDFQSFAIGLLENASVEILGMSPENWQNFHMLYFRWLFCPDRPAHFFADF
jgi:hypothetical protein